MSRWVRYAATPLALAGAGLYLGRHFGPRWRFLRREFPFLSEQNDDALRRLRAYLRIFLLIEYWYGALTGHPLTKAQQRRSACLALLTPLYDDFIDESGAVGAWDDVPEQHPCSAIFRAAGFVRDAHWRRVEEAQRESRLQRQPGCSPETLLRLCAEKGAASVLLGWRVIGEGAGGAAMEQAAARLGFFAQLFNDAFDVWKDREAGIHTLFTDSGDLNVPYRLYQDVLASLLQDIDQLKCGAWSKEKVKALLVLLYGLGQVAIEQLLALQMAQGGVFRVEQHGRKALVCDMQRWRNRLRWGFFVLAHP